MSALGVSPLLTAQEVAAYLRVKPCTVANERKRGKLGFTSVGAKFFYTMDHINQYLKEQENSCETKTIDGVNAVDIGSAKSLGGRGRTIRGAARGTTPKLDKHVVSALARETFKKRA
jgi:hypothetical protein